jgi:HSP20 family protein
MTSANKDTQMQKQKAEQQPQKAQKTQGKEGQLERMESRRAVIPPIDIFEGENETWLVADLPGVGKDDLEIELQANELRLRAHAAGRFDDAPFDYVRAFRLPPGIEGDKVSADLKDGVLTLKLPKPAELKPRRIDVRTV